MTTEKKQQLKDKIIEVYPDIECRNTSVMITAPFSGIINYKDNRITLCDVLRAINSEKNYIGISCEGNFYDLRKDKFFTIKNGFHSRRLKWDLTKNSLDDQRDETKDFLYNLICK